MPERGVELADGLVVEMSPKDVDGYAVDNLTCSSATQRRGQLCRERGQPEPSSRPARRA